MNGNQQQQNKGAIDYNYMVNMLWKHAALLIICGVICGALFFAYARIFVSARYEANALFFVNNSSVNLNNVLRVNSGTQAGVGNYLGILKARSTLEDIIEASGKDIGYKSLRGMISAEAIPNTDLIQVTVNARDPESARSLANAVADVLPGKVSEISASTSLEVVDYAETPESRVSPNYIQYAEMGFLVGFLLSAAIVLAIAYFDTVIRDTEYLEQTYQIPVVAEIPDIMGKSSARYGYGYGYGYYGTGKAPKKPASADGDGKDGQDAGTKKKKPTREQKYLCDNLSFTASEAYKLLRTNMIFSLPEKPCRVLGVTSSVRGEGKSTTAINLSYSFAQSGKRVLLIDADMRLPSIAMKLNMERVPGLSNLIVGMDQEKNCIRKSGYYDNWYILPAGDMPPNPLELLGSERMRALLEHYKEFFDYIILDLPPVNIVADALVASKWTDGMICIVRQGYTDRRALKANMNQTERLGVKILGFVVTFVGIGKGSYSRYGKYSNYGKYGRYGKKYYRYYAKEEPAFEGSEAERKNWEFMDAVKNDLPTEEAAQDSSDKSGKSQDA